MLFINYMKNLDLYHQGEYALRVSIQCERSGRRARFISNPHVGSSAHQTQEDAESRFDTSRQAARISRDGCDYTTASGYIRFRDETVNLNEAIVFEVPVDVNKDFSTETLLLRFGLLYGKPVSHDKTGSTALRRPRTSGASATEPLEEVASHSFRLNCGTRVLAGECMLLFDEMHRQVATSSFFPLLTNRPPCASDASCLHMCLAPPFTSPLPPLATPCPMPVHRCRRHRATAEPSTFAPLLHLQAACPPLQKHRSHAFSCCVRCQCTAVPPMSFAAACAHGSKTMASARHCLTQFKRLTMQTRSCFRALLRLLRTLSLQRPPRCRIL